LHLVGILFPHINDDTRSKSHKMLYSCWKERDLTKCKSAHVWEHCLPIYKKMETYPHYKICWHWCSTYVRVSPNKIGHKPLQLHTSSDLVTNLTLI